MPLDKTKIRFVNDIEPFSEEEKSGLAKHLTDLVHVTPNTNIVVSKGVDKSYTVSPFSGSVNYHFGEFSHRLVRFGQIGGEPNISLMLSSRGKVFYFYPEPVEYESLRLPTPVNSIRNYPDED